MTLVTIFVSIFRPYKKIPCRGYHTFNSSIYVHTFCLALVSFHIKLSTCTWPIKRKLSLRLISFPCYKSHNYFTRRKMWRLLLFQKCVKANRFYDKYLLTVTTVLRALKVLVCQWSFYWRPRCFYIIVLLLDYFSKSTVVPTLQWWLFYRL